MRRLGFHAPWMVLLAMATAYLFLRSGLDFGYVIPRRLARLAAMLIGGACIAWTAIVFQSLTGNRILTPAVMGYEAVYLLLQSLLVLLLGTPGLTLLGTTGNFGISVLVMLGYSWVLHRRLFGGARADVQTLLLLGLVLSLVLATITQFVQFQTSPGEFSVLMGFTQASFNRVQPQALALAAAIVGAVLLVAARTLPTLDVMCLGRDQARSLGVDHEKAVRQHLLLIAVLVAVSTSLLGPTAFMGIFVANTAYALARTHRHRETLPLGCVIATGMFVAAQMAVEHVFNYRTTVGILVNLVCGVFFLALVLRTRGCA